MNLLDGINVEGLVKSSGIVTVRTDHLAYVLDEAVPARLEPQHCSIHRVQWWPEEITLVELKGGKPLCPICTGEVSLWYLIEEEQRRIKLCVTILEEEDERTVTG